MDYFNQESERLIYRRLEESDLDSWSTFFVNNPNLPYLGMPPNKTKDELAHYWLERQFERYRESGFGGLAAISKLNGEFVGIPGLLKKEVKGQIEYEVAYSLKKDYWRQGYGFEMASTMKNFAIRHKIHPRVISIIHRDNIGSIKVAEKNGMSYLFDVEYLEMPCLVYGVAI